MGFFHVRRDVPPQNYLTFSKSLFPRLTDLSVRLAGLEQLSAGVPSALGNTAPSPVERLTIMGGHPKQSALEFVQLLTRTFSCSLKVLVLKNILGFPWTPFLEFLRDSPLQLEELVIHLSDENCKLRNNRLAHEETSDLEIPEGLLQSAARNVSIGGSMFYNLLQNCRTRFEEVTEED